MSQNILISVIIPTYNRCDLLKLAVESCLRQDYSNLEIIIIDDGSSDGTEQMVSHLLVTDWKDCCIRYVLQENAGASSARNHGIEMAQGEFIQFLDSDDELLPGKLTMQILAIDDLSIRNCDMCYCYGRMGAGRNESYTRLGINTSNVSELLLQLVGRKIHVMSTPSPLWRSSFLKRFNGWNTKIGLGDDLEYYLRLVCELDSFVFIPDELFFVREHSGDRLGAGKITKEALKSEINTQKEIYKSLNDFGWWNPQIVAAYFRGLRTLYAHTLTYGNIDTVSDVEIWLKDIGRGESTFREIRRLIVLRSLIGSKGLMLIHRTLSVIRRGSC